MIEKNGEINLPENIKLVQFFYDWEEFPWETENDGCCSRIILNFALHSASFG